MKQTVSLKYLLTYALTTSKIDLMEKIQDEDHEKGKQFLLTGLILNVIALYPIQTPI